jgi:meiotic recombination protein SPO11
MDFDLLQDLLREPQEAQHGRKDNSLLSYSSSRLIQRQLDPPCLTTHVQHIDISQPSQKTNSQAGAIIAKLEDIFESLLDCIIDEKKGLVLHLKSRGKSIQQTLDPATGTIRNIGTAEAKEIGFPGKTQREAWKFGKQAMLRL